MWRRAPQAFAKYRLCFGSVTTAKKGRTERLTDPVIPGWRLVITESILCFDGTPPNGNCGVGIGRESRFHSFALGPPGRIGRSPGEAGPTVARCQPNMHSLVVVSMP
jgi:hypothetical protein